MNVYIFQSGAFEDQINMKSLTWALIQHDIRQGETGEDGSVKMEAETKVTLPKPRSTLGRVKGGHFARASKGTRP